MQHAKVHIKCGGCLIYSCLDGNRIGYRCLRCGWTHQKKPRMSKLGLERRSKMGWEKKSAEKINFEEEGMITEGRVISIQPSNLGVNSYTLSCEGGVLVSFLGTTVLDRLLSDELGNVVKIKYLGDMKTSRGFRVKQFEVFVWREGEVETPLVGDLA